MTNEELARLVNHYRPNKGVLEAMRRIELLVTVGPSASGKTTLMEHLTRLSPHVHFVLDETSRAPRPGERQAVDFLFRNRTDILEDLDRGELVQVALGPNGDLYCTRLTSYPMAGVGMIALVPAAVKELRELPIGSLKAAFIVPASFELWQKWLDRQAQTSGWSDQKKAERLAEAKASYEFALADKKIRFVLNDEVSKAAHRLLQVCQGHAPVDEKQARQTAEDNYQKLKDL